MNTKCSKGKRSRNRGLAIYYIRTFCHLLKTGYVCCQQWLFFFFTFLGTGKDTQNLSKRSTSVVRVRNTYWNQRHREMWYMQGISLAFAVFSNTLDAGLLSSRFRKISIKSWYRTLAEPSSLSQRPLPPPSWPHSVFMPQSHALINHWGGGCTALDSAPRPYRWLVLPLVGEAHLVLQPWHRAPVLLGMDAYTSQANLVNPAFLCSLCSRACV